uniref:Malectin n=1 Tax=Cyanistes caeruleus TaxID=156563 RepID=A0A8C0VMC7_CYACU
MELLVLLKHLSLFCFLHLIFILTASDYGMKLPILRSNAEDQILYQTERYNEETFGYEVPIKEEGDYVLVLKFAEVYFAQSQQKVFDVRLNGHVVVKDLDIFDRVGHSTAHDEIIPMSIKKGKLSVQGEVSTFTGKLHIEFVKGYYDNPKICALYILQGTVEDVPKLQPHPGLEKKEEDDDEDDYDDGSSVKKQIIYANPRTTFTTLTSPGLRSGTLKLEQFYLKLPSHLLQSTRAELCTQMLPAVPGGWLWEAD